MEGFETKKVRVSESVVVWLVGSRYYRWTFLSTQIDLYIQAGMECAVPISPTIYETESGSDPFILTVTFVIVSTSGVSFMNT
jgi:hypothetical protein